MNKPKVSKLEVALYVFNILGFAGLAITGINQDEIFQATLSFMLMIFFIYLTVKLLIKGETK